MNTDAQRLAIQLLAHWNDGEDPVKQIMGVQDLYPKHQGAEYEADLRVAKQFQDKFEALAEELVDIVAEALIAKGIVT